MARRGWKAEEWRGLVNAVRLERARIPLEAREAGVTDVREFYGDPRTWCAACGTPLWHYWVFARADGASCEIGQECAAVILGQSPCAFLKDEEERREVEGIFAREEADRAARASWWRAPEQRALRTMVVLGARLERTTRTRSEFYSRARRSALAGALSPKFREWVERASKDGVRAVVERTAQGLDQLWALYTGVRASKFDAPVIHDLADREFPVRDDRRVWGAPLSAAQAALVEKLHKRYSKQLKAATTA